MHTIFGQKVNFLSQFYMHSSNDDDDHNVKYT